MSTELQLDKSGWKPVTFGDVVQEVRQTTKDPVADGIERVVGLEHIETECIHLRNWASIKEETTFTKIFRKGHVLFGRRRAYLKKAAQAEFDGICSGDITVMEAKDGLLPELLPFLVCNDKFFDYAVQHSAGGLSPRTKFKDLANYDFLLPPKDQQAKLAELLWAADAAVEAALALVQKTDASRRAFIANCFSEKAEHYVRLQNAADIRYGLTINSKRNTLPHRRPYLRVANVSREKIDLTEVKDVGCSDSDLQCFMLEQGDVLIVEGHANIQEIGRSAIWKVSAQEMLHQNHLIRARCNVTLAPRFLSAYINSPRGRGYFQGMAKSTSGLNTINSTVVKDFKVPAVPKGEQIDFITKLDCLETSGLLAAKNHERLRIVIKSLINQIL